MDENTIEYRFPDLMETGEYTQFVCRECGTKNGTTAKKDTDGSLVVVCGSCWTKQVIK